MEKTKRQIESERLISAMIALCGGRWAICQHFKWSEAKLSRVIRGRHQRASDYKLLVNFLFQKTRQQLTKGGV